MSGIIQISDSVKLENVFGICWHINLITIFDWLLNILDEVIITSAYRPNKIYTKDSGIHSTNPLRAIDLRSYIYSNPKYIKNLINNNWIYDQYRPNLQVAVLHDIGKGIHFHIQVHENTRKVIKK